MPYDFKLGVAAFKGGEKQILMFLKGLKKQSNLDINMDKRFISIKESIIHVMLEMVKVLIMEGFGKYSKRVEIN